jgi:hypothetical protein
LKNLRRDADKQIEFFAAGSAVDIDLARMSLEVADAPAVNDSQFGAMFSEEDISQIDGELHWDLTKPTILTRKLMASRQGRLKAHYRAQRARMLVLPAVRAVFDDILQLESTQGGSVEKTLCSGRPARRISNQTGIRFNVLKDNVRPIFKILPIARSVSNTTQPSRLFDFIPFPVQ